MPWLSEVKGLLEAYLGGQAGGAAVANILYGKVNPSGKLAETIPLKLSDNPSYLNFGGDENVEYREGVFVGYRYYDTKEMNVAYPFGYGLSYTTFTYSNLQISNENPTEKDTLTVSVDVTNTGTVAGKEVVQLYVKDCTGSAIRPEKELKGFEKVSLNPGETKTVTLELDKRSFAWYNTTLHDWFAASGEYKILIGASSRDICLEGTVHMNSIQEIPMHVHMNTTLGELFRNPKTSATAKELTSAYLSAMNGGEENASEAASEAVTEEMTQAMTDSMPLRALMSFGGFSREKLVEIIEKLNSLV